MPLTLGSNDFRYRLLYNILMSLQNEKLVLTGGMFSKATIDTARDISGVTNPRLSIDTSPKVSPESYQKSRSVLGKWFADYGKLTPEWLDIEQPGASPGAAIEQIQATDILVVTGGSTKKAMDRWIQHGVADVIRQRVSSGEMTVHGASAGAMIWFEQGFSDSMSYEISEAKWSYITTPGMGILPAWITAHHDDTDEYGRDRAEHFRRSLAENHSKWTTALGLESHAVLVCTQGLAKVMDARGDGKYSHDIHIYTPNNQGLPRHETLSSSNSSDEWFSLASE